MTTPRGERLANPLNLRHSAAKWQGMAQAQPDPEFVAFSSPIMGIRAAARNLLTYHRRDRLNTVRGIVSKWAPPEDHNDTGAYIAAVSREMAVGPDDAIDLEKPHILKALVVAMMRVELGRMPYSPEIIEGGVLMAYKPPAGTVQVTRPVDQPTAAPTPKVAAAAVGGSVGLIVGFVLVALWNLWMPESQLPPEAATTLGSAISVVLAVLSAYFKRDHAIVVNESVDPEVPAS